jgi:hypothetical protein
MTIFIAVSHSPPSVEAVEIRADHDFGEAQLLAQINAGHLPAAVLDAAGNVNTIYMIYFPPGKTITRSRPWRGGKTQTAGIGSGALTWA